MLKLITAIMFQALLGYTHTHVYVYVYLFFKDQEIGSEIK